MRYRRSGLCDHGLALGDLSRTIKLLTTSTAAKSVATITTSLATTRTTTTMKAPKVCLGAYIIQDGYYYTPEEAEHDHFNSRFQMDSAGR